MNPLDQIIGVTEAAKLWGLSPDRVKGMCQRSEINAKKIGRTWVIDRNQANPKKYNRSDDMFTVVLNKEVVDAFGDPDFVLETDFRTENEQDAIKEAKRLALNNPYKQVFIEYFRKSDGQHGFLNPNGYDLEGVNWSKAIAVHWDDTDREVVIDEYIADVDDESKHAMIVAKVTLHDGGTVYRVDHEMDNLGSGYDVFFEEYEDAKEYAQWRVDLI